MKFTKYETCAICTETLFVLYAHNIGSKENTNIVDIASRHRRIRTMLLF